MIGKMKGFVHKADKDGSFVYQQESIYTHFLWMLLP